MRAMRQSWQAQRDAAEALQLLGNSDRRGQSIEQKLLYGLAKHGPNDYLNALENVIYYSLNRLIKAVNYCWMQ